MHVLQKSLFHKLAVLVNNGTAFAVLKIKKLKY